MNLDRTKIWCLDCVRSSKSPLKIIYHLLKLEKLPSGHFVKIPRILIHSLGPNVINILFVLKRRIRVSVDAKQRIIRRIIPGNIYNISRVSCCWLLLVSVRGKWKVVMILCVFAAWRKVVVNKRANKIKQTERKMFHYI